MKTREEQAIELLKGFIEGKGDHKDDCSVYHGWRDSICNCGYEEFIYEVKELVKSKLEKSLT